jgi:GntR family transcriptional regulator
MRHSTPTKPLDRSCTTSNNTPVIPFRVDFRPGTSLYEQVVYAAKKALVSGQLRPGDAFPSVRALSAALKINPNTAHKVITHLLNEGLLEVMPGTGTVVATPPESSVAERTRLLETEVEQLVVEAKKLGMGLREVTSALAEHWQRLEAHDGFPAAAKGARQRK